MGFNGSGTFNRLRSWVTDAGNGLKIRSDLMDSDTNDIASGLSNTICKDGQSIISANIPFNNKKITGLGAATAGTDAVQFQQIQNGSTQYAAASGTNTITATFTPTLTSLTDGQEFKIKAAATNTAACTFNPDSQGAQAIVLQDGTALAGGEMISGGEYTLRYKLSSTNYQLLNPSQAASTSALIRDNTDTTKRLQHIINGFTTGQTRTVTWPDANITVASTATTQNLTNKAFDSTSTVSTATARDNSTKLASTAYADNSASTVPVNSQSAAYTTVLTDAGKTIWHPTADNNARTFTIDSNANVAYPVGTCITFINEINTVTIAITADTLVLAGAGSTGSRTLAANGMATAIKVSSTRWYISGTNLT